MWDPSTVISFLTAWCPNESLSLEKLTRKLVTLLALASSQRGQTLSLIKIENIEFRDLKGFIKIPDKIKISGLNRLQRLIELDTLGKNSEICVLNLLKY